jgi:isopenicillin-N epimerase
LPNPETLREQFLLRPDLAFLNHGSFGACPRPVFEDYQRWQLELERQPVEFLGRRFADLMRAARAKLAAHLRTAADNVVYVPNATTAINLAARSLRLEPGDEILTTDHEYGALDRAWRFLCGKSGAVYRAQAIPVPVRDAEQFVETLWAGVTPRTRVIFLSHITSPTALILPVEAVCRRARAAGLLTLVDGAHAVGQIPLDLDALGADFYTSNCHKWLCAPKGSAFLYVRPELQARVEPLVVSWGWQSDTPGPSRFVDEQEWTGTRDIAAYLATPAALEFMAHNRWDEVRAACHALAVETWGRLAALTKLPPLSDESWFEQMFAAPLPPCDTTALQRRLYDEFGVEVPVYLWNRQPLVRVSIQGYNTRQDADRLLRALARLLPEVRIAQPYANPV